jgi:hypothetical protein
MQTPLLKIAGPAALALCLLAPGSARAQTPVPPYRPLPIPLPDQAQVSVEIDAHHDDLLGVAKSMLKGLNLPALMQMMQGMAPGMGFPDIRPNGAPAPDGAEGQAGPGAPGMVLPAAPNFADLFKGIHQMHLVVFKPANKDPEQIIKFYEAPFQEQGGRRILWINQGANKVLMMGFSEPRRGFALIMPMGEEVAVVRADGYPDLEGVGSFVTMFATLVGSMRSTLSDVFSGPDVATPSVEAYPDYPRSLPNRGVKRRPAKLAPTPKPARAPIKKAPAKR